MMISMASTRADAQPKQALPVDSSTEERWWGRVRERQPDAADPFVYAVITTGVFCRPGCASRRPKRENTRFFRTGGEALRAGFRPCRRCRPLEVSADPHLSQVAAACARMDAAEEPVALATLAAEAGMATHHFHRVFRRLVGVTPKQYANGRRLQAFRDALDQGHSVTDAVYEAGFGASSRLYAQSHRHLGMTPRAYQRGGPGETVRYATAPCVLGTVLVAATGRGVCAILLGDAPAPLAEELRRRFHRAQVEPGADTLNQLVRRVVEGITHPERGMDLPLDVRGTAFQMQVWQALQSIRPGETVHYSELARRLGRAQAVRAVAQACGANPVAVAIPCHRVVPKGGGVGGYRWGPERKRQLLCREEASVADRRSSTSVKEPAADAVSEIGLGPVE